jgi:hypothetical protein
MAFRMPIVPVFPMMVSPRLKRSVVVIGEIENKQRAINEERQQKKTLKSFRETLTT